MKRNSSKRDSKNVQRPRRPFRSAGPAIKSDRAVSEVIGYVIIFGIVILSIGMIYAVGFPVLRSSTDATQFKSIEQGFLILQTDLFKVALDQAPVRTTKLGTAEGGSLRSDPDACNLTIEITHGGTRDNHTIAMGNIEFNSRVGSVACENGAVVVKYQAGSVMLSNPRMFNSTDQGDILFSLVKINDSFSSRGGGIAQVTISNPRFNESIFNTPAVYEKGDLRLKFDSVYSDAWERFIIDEFDTLFDPTTGWSDEIPFKKLVIVEYIVSVDVG
ncbi:MAG: hypothetical protein C5S52_03065 [ANME-2 cluster archaeon]|nr:hypothetical protein [ANME-2 cluster archaeon]